MNWNGLQIPPKTESSTYEEELSQMLNLIFITLSILAIIAIICQQKTSEISFLGFCITSSRFNHLKSENAMKVCQQYRGNIKYTRNRNDILTSKIVKL